MKKHALKFFNISARNKIFTHPILARSTPCSTFLPKLLIRQHLGASAIYFTPTWAVAGICAFIIIISILLEKVLHKIGEWFTEKHKRALFEALEKVKAELMVMGFISLIFTFSQSYVGKNCIPAKLVDTMLPYKSRWYRAVPVLLPLKKLTGGFYGMSIDFYPPPRHLGARRGMSHLSQIRGWKVWEHETSSLDYEFSNDPSRFRLTHETSFVKAHASFWTRVPIFFLCGSTKYEEWSSHQQLKFF